MKNNKGFTLVELLATLIVLSLVMTIGTYSITNIIENAKDKNYQILIANIKDAAETYYNECQYMETIGECQLTIKLQTLLDYGYIKSNDEDNSNNLINPKEKDEKGQPIIITDCKIKITKDDKGNIKIEAKEPTDSCPTEY